MISNKEREAIQKKEHWQESCWESRETVYLRRRDREKENKRGRKWKEETSNRRKYKQRDCTNVKRIANSIKVSIQVVINKSCRDKEKNTLKAAKMRKKTNREESRCIERW